MATNTNNMDLVPQEVLNELKALDGQLAATKKNLESLLEPVKSVSEELAKSSVNYKKLTDLITKLNEVEKKAIVTFKEQDKTLGEVQKLKEKLIGLHSDEAREVALLKEQIRQKNKENRESAKVMLDEAEAAERLADRLNDLPEDKSVTVTVKTVNTTEGKGAEPGSEGETVGQAEAVKRSVEELGAAFARVSESGFADISGMLKANAAGITDYSGAMNALGTRLASVQSLQEDYKAAMDGGLITQEEYTRKAQALETVENNLRQALQQVIAEYAQAKKEAENVSYSTDAAGEAFSSLSERAKELTAELIEMRSEQEQVKNSLKELESAYGDGTVTEEDYKRQKAELSTLYDDNSRAIKKVTQELALEVKATGSAAGSYDNLSARYSQLKMKLNAMAGAGKENTEEFKKMQEEARELYEEMKNLQSATGKDQLNVGNYSELPEWLEETIGQLSQVPGAASAAAGGFSSISGAMKALMANPIVALIAAIVAVLSTLFSAFKQSETGSRLLEKAGNALSAVMLVLTGIMEKVAQGIKDMFENPKESLISFGELLKNMLIARFQAAVTYVVALKDAAVALFNLDFDQVGESLKEAGASLLTIVTGVPPEAMKKVVAGVTEATNAFGEYNKALNKLADDTLAVKKQNEALERQIADLSVEEAKYSTIAQDTSRSMEERLEAEEKAHAAAEKRAAAEYQAAKSSFDLVKRELELYKKNGKNVDELETKYTDAYKAMRQAQQQYIAEREKSEQRKNGIILQNAVKEIDILTETTASQIALNLKRVKDDETSYGQREGIIENSRKMLEASLAAELACIQQYASEIIDTNALLAEESQTAVTEQIQAMGLPVQMQEKLLKVIKDYRQQKQALNDADAASEKKRVNDILKDINREANARGREISQKESGDYADLSKEYESGLMSEEVYQAKKKAIADKYAMERFEAEKAAMQKSLDIVGLSEDQRLRIEEQIAGKQLDIDQMKNDKEMAAAEALAEKKKELLQDVFNFANQLIEQQFQAQLDQLDAESEENEAWAEEEKERIDRLEESGAISKEEADARKAAVDEQAKSREEEIEQKKKEILKKQAIYERAMTIAKIGWSTAQAIMAAMEWGYPMGPILAAAAGAIGAVQVASVLATPIPEYAEGTKDHPGGLAVVGDGGRSEMVIANGLIYKTPATDTLVDLPAHAVVFPDFNKAMAMPKLPQMPEKEDRVISFEELSGLMKENNKSMRDLVGKYKKTARIGKYGKELSNKNIVIR